MCKYSRRPTEVGTVLVNTHLQDYTSGFFCATAPFIFSRNGVWAELGHQCMGMQVSCSLTLLSAICTTVRAQGVSRQPVHITLPPHKHISTTVLHVWGCSVVLWHQLQLSKRRSLADNFLWIAVRCSLHFSESLAFTCNYTSQYHSQQLCNHTDQAHA